MRDTKSLEKQSRVSYFHWSAIGYYFVRFWCTYGWPLLADHSNNEWHGEVVWW